MIKIAYIIDTITTSEAGTEKQLLMLLHKLDRSAFKPYLICLRKSAWLSENTLPCDVHVLNVGSLVGLSCLWGLLSFRKLARTERFDIVQTFFVDGNIFGTFAARFSGCKTVVSSRRNIGYWHNRVHINILKFLRRWTDRYLCNSQAASDLTATLEHVLPSKIQVLYNGLDFEPFEAITDNDRHKQRHDWSVNEGHIVVGAVANLRPVKNIQLLIDAASVLVREFTELRFVVIGEGGLRDELQCSIDSLALRDRFTLIGQHNNIPLALSAFDIAVMPSLSESFSNSLIEYMAARLPIVSSDAGGNSEAIEHDETGLLFSLDDKDGLLNCIRELLLDRTKGKLTGRNAYHEALRKYDIGAMTARHQTYYKKILE